MPKVRYSLSLEIEGLPAADDQYAIRRLRAGLKCLARLGLVCREIRPVPVPPTDLAQFGGLHAPPIGTSTRDKRDNWWEGFKKDGRARMATARAQK